MNQGRAGASIREIGRCFPEVPKDLGEGELLDRFLGPTRCHGDSATAPLLNQ